MSDHYDELAQSYHDLAERWAAVKNKIEDYFQECFPYDDEDNAAYNALCELADLVA